MNLQHVTLKLNAWHFGLQTYFSFFGVIMSAGAADPTADPFTGCFGGGPGRLSDTTGVLTIDTATMQPGNTYVFKVVVTKNNAKLLPSNFSYPRM